MKSSKRMQKRQASDLRLPTPDKSDYKVSLAVCLMLLLSGEAGGGCKSGLSGTNWSSEGV